MRDIYGSDGMLGLFRGHSATLLRIFPYAGIKFLAYEQIRNVIITGKHEETPWRRLASGSIAGMCNPILVEIDFLGSMICVANVTIGVTSVFLVYPLEVIRVRLAFDTTTHHRASLAQICKQIYNEQPPEVRPSHYKSIPTMTPSDILHNPGQAIKTAESAVASGAHAISTATQAVTQRRGMANFYRGFSPTLVGMIPYAGVSFLTHDTAGDWLRRPELAPYTTLHSSESGGKTSDKQGRPQLKVWAEFLAGGSAGMISQTASYPLEIIRRRMQVGGAVGDGRRWTMSETAKKIWTERGFKGFWVGLGIGYFKVVPMVATSFFVYERSKTYLGI
jgi:solute carrier family 25 (mitochondrial carrier protein), member 16